jgi:hypothetical protein
VLFNYFISGNEKSSSIINGTEVTYINNSNYKTTSYIVDNYKIENSKIQKGYKLPEDIYRDLNLESASTLLPYDKIPVVEKLNYLRIPETNLLKHNFNDITAANIIITDVVDNVANVMIFITFKNKLLIIKTKYDYSNEENNFNMSLDLNVAGGDFIELDRVNPADSSSIKFLNLNALKVYKNMLYLIDSELNMVLRYDIDLLTSSGESIETFDTSSIKLVNI